MACERKTKGKISFTDKGITKEIIVPTAPFFVSCTPASPCGIQGIRIISYEAAVSGNSGTSSFNSFKNEIIFFKAVPQSGAYDGNRYDLWGSCPDGEREIYRSFSVGSGAITIINNNFSPDSSNGLIVRDSSNNILFNIAVSECNYQISCDDDCPEGSHKCTHNKYPGYCCVPCKQVGDRLKNIANKVGQ